MAIFRVRNLDKYVADAAKVNVVIDIENRTPAYHEVAFGLNVPVLLVVGLIAQVFFPQGSDPDRSVPFQILLGGFVPVFWFVVVGWVRRTRERLRIDSSSARSLKRFGLLFSAIAVLFSLWIVLLHLHQSHLIFKYLQ